MVQYVIVCCNVMYNIVTMAACTLNLWQRIHSIQCADESNKTTRRFLQHTATQSVVLQRGAAWCSVVQRVAACCSVVQCVVVHVAVLQCMLQSMLQCI